MFRYATNYVGIGHLLLICFIASISTSFTTALSVHPLTSAVLRVSYDGSLFHGWASNDGPNSPLPHDEYQPRRSGRSRRNRLRPSMKKGEVRTVQGTLKGALSKLYGNVPVDRIVVEGCSRTDKGVHSQNSLALIYCLIGGDGPLSIEGKRLPHPTSPEDESFKVLPFDSDLEHMISSLNRMLPPDVVVLNASPMPIKGSDDSSSSRPFHPSLDSQWKTYRYTLSVGEIRDPIRCR